MCVCVNIKVIIHVEEKQCMGGGYFHNRIIPTPRKRTNMKAEKTDMNSIPSSH